MLSERVKFLVKWLTLLVLAYVLIFVVRPIYYEAWQIRGIAGQVANSSRGLSRSVVTEQFLKALEASSIRRIARSEVNAERLVDGWSVGATYQVQQQFKYGLTLVYSFNISSEGRQLW